jgi:hypothetical protein
LLVLGCGGEAVKSVPAKPAAVDTTVGYELRRLRPRDEERWRRCSTGCGSLAAKDGKRVAVLFSADWCEPCRCSRRSSAIVTRRGDR